MKHLNSKLDKVSTHPLQTNEWATFREEWGNKVLRTSFGVITIHSIPHTNLKVGNYIKGLTPTIKMLSELKKLAVENNIIYIKMEPNVVTKVQNVDLESTDKSKNNDKVKLQKLLLKNGATKGKTLFTPTSFWIDLTLSENDLLKSFSSKTRYNIRLAERKGVTIKEDNSDKAFDTYLKLTKETVQRQRYFAHTKRYHKLMWKVLNKDMTEDGKEPIARLLTAKYNNKIISTWVIFTWKDFMYYPYGASTHEHKDVMANNLMMWEAIRFGKKLGLKTFDLWGREDGKGFTKFKEGYNPKVVEFLGTWDLVINKNLYKVYLIIDKLRWITLRTKSRLVKPTF